MNTEEQKRIELIESKVIQIEKDLKGGSTSPGVFEKLRHLEKLVKISIAVSVLGAGSTQINWDFVLKLLS